MDRNTPCFGPYQADAGQLLCGKYRIEAEIGRGGMGVVYRAMHTGLDRRVAIKVVLPELTRNEVVVQRMLDEARSAAQITSEHVVRVMDVGRLESGQPFIVMEFVEGEDLAHVLDRDGTPPLEIAVSWVLEASVAIAEAHDKGIVHRDLKPENLFLARAEHGETWVKVLDFGISKRLDRSGRRSVTHPTDMMGSPHYMAPEQIRTPLAVDARADIWSLGTILIELLTGRQAFGGDTLGSVCAKVLEAEPDLPEAALAALPPALLALVRRAVEKDPNHRFQSIAEFAAALAPFAPPRALASLRSIAQRSPRVLSERAFPASDCNLALPNAAPEARARRRVGIAVALMTIAGALAVESLWRNAARPAPLDASPGAVPMPARALPPLGSSVTPEPELSHPVPQPFPPAAAPAEPLETPASTPSGAPARSAPAAQAGTKSARRTLEPAAANERAHTTPTVARPHDVRESAWDLSTFGGRR